MEYRDYYKVLGVARAATPEDIKKSYRRLARKFHPDVSKEPNAEEKFKEVQEAYQVLKDPEKRAAFDELGNDWKAVQSFRPPPDWANGHESNSHARDRGAQSRHGAHGSQEQDFSEFFSSLFGGASPFAAGQSYPGARDHPIAGRLMRDLGINVSGAALAVELLETQRALERRIRHLET